jgi:DNA-binding response OmpR family regulator
MILVVDDDPTMVELIQELLCGEGYEVRTAPSGTVAYAHLRDPLCKGMLLDMFMPGINGPELLMLMAADGSRVPVIALVDSPDFEEAEIKQFPNVRRLLHKPVYPEDVLAAVRQYFQRPSASRRHAGT